ncbi:unnamed protein product [Caenorhabditis brenneri]
MLPLLRLPLRVQNLVFEHMHDAYKLAISLLSVKTRNLIKSLRIHGRLSSMRIGYWIRIGFDLPSCYFALEFYEGQKLQPSMPFPPTNQLFIRHSEGNGEKQVVWTFGRELTMKKWLEHFMDVLDTPKIDELKFSRGGQRFCLEPLKEIALNYNTLTIDERYSDEDTLSITNMLLGDNALQLGRGSIKTHQILIQNIRKIDLFKNFQLNDLLACNSSIIESHSKFPDKSLNQFFKLWIQGANPRFQKLILRWPFSFGDNCERDTDVILKGIHTIPVSIEHKAELPRHRFHRRPLIQTEVDMRRQDGFELPTSNQMPSANSRIPKVRSTSTVRFLGDKVEGFRGLMHRTMVTPRIPLLRFPLRVQTLVFKNMNEVYQLAISLLSVKARKLIKSLRIYTYLPSILTSNCIRIGFEFRLNYFLLDFYEGQKLQPHTPIPPTNQLFITYRDEDYGQKRVVWTFKKKWTLKNWLDHFMDVLNIPKFEKMLFFRGVQRFCIESLKEIADCCESLSIGNLISDEDTLKITNTLLGEKALALRTLEASIKMHQILIQNIRKIDLFKNFQLNDLLVCNNSNIHTSSKFPDKSLNRFFKLWIQGANPRLQKFNLQYPFSFVKNLIHDPSVILKGIHTTPVSIEHKARLPRHPCEQPRFHPFIPSQRLMQTKVDMKSKNGKRATLVVTNHIPCCADIMFIVWD